MAVTSSRAWNFVRGYGPLWESGVLVDHVDEAVDAGATRGVVDGLEVIVIDGDTIPVVCGDIIEIRTEDGPSTGRCGTPVKAGHPTCEGHAWVHDMSDAEWAFHERQMG